MDNITSTQNTNKTQTDIDSRKMSKYIVLSTTIIGGTMLNKTQSNNKENLNPPKINNEIDVCSTRRIDTIVASNLEHDNEAINQPNDQEEANIEAIKTLTPQEVQKKLARIISKVCKSNTKWCKNDVTNNLNDDEETMCAEDLISHQETDQAESIKPTCIANASTLKNNKQIIAKQINEKYLSNSQTYNKNDNNKNTEEINNNEEENKEIIIDQEDNSKIGGNSIHEKNNKDVSTQTESFKTTKNHLSSSSKKQLAKKMSYKKNISLDVNKELWLVVNCCLHASYFYFYLGFIFASSNLTALTWRYQQQEHRHRKMAGQIMSELASSGASVGLVDVPRPTIKCSNSVEAMQVSQQLEVWIQERLEEVWSLARRNKHGAVNMLKQMVEEQKEQVLAMSSH